MEAADLRDSYDPSKLWRLHSLAAGQALLAIYKWNVFPDLKVTWGTYPNNLGHTDYPGCFRCHDDSHLQWTELFGSPNDFEKLPNR